MSNVDYIEGWTWHGRKGDLENAFRYSVDYVMFNATHKILGPALFSRNAAGVFSVYDTDHGGPPNRGRGVAWVKDVLRSHGVELEGDILLLAQPRVLGHVFNPVSFWLCHNATGDICAVISEVTNTFGDRHSYLCHHDDLRPILPTDTLSAQKIFHVSPFQPIDGNYVFRFDIRPDKIGIWIDLQIPGGGVMANLIGPRRPLRTVDILRALLRRPFGSRRVLGLIHWQAFKLWRKGAKYRKRPSPPETEVSL
ncbi:MAG: DUF1365 domain-containing protein [Paracoccaceae bacterium]|jgi:DUF1365 family protein|tara:strand:- start:1336 stop:2091 length:756 start_codon:yes stop_codon:yes gene_type:complete